MTNISVLILTLNEELNLARCLESVSWSDDVVVLDSYSTDGTLSIAQNYGARVIQRKFDGYAKQRNFGIREISYKNPWLLMVDADEEVTSELHDEIIRNINGADQDTSLFRMRRKDYLMGRWIKRSSGYPTWFGRLIKLGHVWVEREINEEYHTDGKVANLQGHLNHYPFNKGFAEWLEKHNRYSNMEAQHRFECGSERVLWRSLFSNDPQQRRIEHKKLYYAMPARPWIAFLGLYFLRGGILEGRAGFVFSSLRAVYEWMIDLKQKELQRRDRNLPL